MGFVAALLIITHSGAPIVAEAPSRPVVAAQATARVLRPARISFQQDAEPDEARSAQNQSVQRGRDEAGTMWVEFS